MAKAAMKEVLQQHKSRGTLPAGMLRLLAQLDDAEEDDWKQFIDKMVGSKFSIRRFKGTMKKPSRRLGVGFIGHKRVKRGTLVYVIDSSGSMSDVELGVAVSNGKQIAKRYGAPFLVLVVDAAVHTVKMIKKAVDLDELEVLGGGGTSSLPAFNYLEENKINVDLMVYLTDLYIDFPEEKPKCIRQMVWAVVNNDSAKEVPFGEMFHVKIPEKKK
jgi:predicted metal-dependent peptidase